MSEKFSTIVEKALSLQGTRSTSQFARDIGMQQSTLDLYLKGKRKPSIELVYCICRNCHVSADWLLGLAQSAPPQPSRKVDDLKKAIITLLKEY